MIVRDFNKIEIKGDKLLKTFIGPDNLAYTMADEISYYQKIQDSIFPKIYEFYHNGYLMEYFKDYQPLQSSHISMNETNCKSFMYYLNKTNQLFLYMLI